MEQDRGWRQGDPFFAIRSGQSDVVWTLLSLIGFFYILLHWNSHYQNVTWKQCWRLERASADSVHRSTLRLTIVFSWNLLHCTINVWMSVSTKWKNSVRSSSCCHEVYIYILFFFNKLHCKHKGMNLFSERSS